MLSIDAHTPSISLNVCWLWLTCHKMATLLFHGANGATACRHLREAMGEALGCGGEVSEEHLKTLEEQRSAAAAVVLMRDFTGGTFCY